MLRLFKNCFNITNGCLIVAVPLIVFLSIFGWYYTFAAAYINDISKFIFAAITAVVLVCGCMSGWFYMLKKAMYMSTKIIVFDRDRVKALRELFMSLLNGIGKLFLPMIGVVLIYFILYFGLLSVVCTIISKYVASVDFQIYNLASVFMSSQELINQMNELSNEELLVIDAWYLGLIFVTTVVSFLTLLWIPEIVYGEKNPYKALFISIAKVFKTFKHSFCLFIYISFLIVLISILNTLLMFNPFLYFIVLSLYYYFMIYIVVLLFTYYEQEFSN